MSVARGFISSAGARFAILPLTGLATLLIARFVTGKFGLEAYAAYSLVASLPLLLPISDLGLGAAVTNAAGALPDSATNFIKTRSKSLKILAGVSAIFLLGDAAVFLSVGWPLLLGLPSSSGLNVGVTTALALFSAGIPASIGAATLIGLRRNQLLVLLQGAAPILTALLVFGLSETLNLFPVAVALSLVGLFLSNWISFFVASRRPEVRRAKKSIAGAAELVPARVWDTALPMMLITLSLPLAFQSGRLVLSWRSTPIELAIYSAAMVSFLPVFSVIQVAGRSLWGVFARVRTTGGSGTKEFRSGLLTCGLIGALGGAGLVVFGPWISTFAVHDKTELPVELFWILGALVFVQSIHLPSGMFLTDSSGLRFQAITTSVMGIVVLASSLVLSPEMGALGPAGSLLVGMVFCQLIPCLVKATQQMRSTEAIHNSKI